MSASGRILDEVRRARRPMRFLGASGQLGYGIPTPAFNAGLARKAKGGALPRPPKVRINNYF